MAFLSLAGNIERPCLLIHPLILMSHLWLCPCHFPFMHISLQVIYKKFQIPCPFEEFSANSTAAHLSLNVSSHGHEYNNGVVHEDEDAHCITRMFTINSQVGSSGQNRVCMSGLFFNIKATNVEFCRCTRLPEFPHLFWEVNPRKSRVCVFLTDGIHHSHLGFRLCLSPWSPPYLHWAPKVSHLSVACNIW